MRIEKKPIDGATVVLCCVVYFLGLLTIGQFLDRGLYGTIAFDVLIAIVGSMVYATGVRPYLRANVRDRTVNVLLAVLFVAACCVAMFSVSCIQRLHDPYPVRMFAGYEGVDAFAYGLLTILLAPVAEEFLFRGVLFTYFMRHCNYVLSTLFVSVVFGFLHGTQVQLYSCIVLSLVSCLVFHVTGNILWSMAVHSANNVFMLFLQPMLSVPGDASVRLTVACVLNCVLILIYTLLLLFVDRKGKGTP